MPIFELDWAISVKSHVWKFSSDWLSFPRVSGNRRYLNFQWGQKPPIRGSYMWPVMPIFELVRAIPVKSHVWKLGGGGLHLTCHTHFRTLLTYSSQKSCMKIWFGLVDIGGMLIFRGGGGGERERERSPLLDGVTCALRCPFSNTVKLFQSKVMCENLVQIGWAFQELSW